MSLLAVNQPEETLLYRAGAIILSLYVYCSELFTKVPC